MIHKPDTSPVVLIIRRQDTPFARLRLHSKRLLVMPLHDRDIKSNIKASDTQHCRAIYWSSNATHQASGTGQTFIGPRMQPKTLDTGQTNCIGKGRAS